LADFAFGQERILEIYSEVGEVGAGAFTEGERWPADQDGNEIGGEGAHFEVGGTFAKF